MEEIATVLLARSQADRSKSNTGIDKDKPVKQSSQKEPTSGTNSSLRRPETNSLEGWVIAVVIVTPSCDLQQVSPKTNEDAPGKACSR